VSATNESPARCPMCERKVYVRKDGTIGTHYVNSYDAESCPGSGQKYDDPETERVLAEYAERDVKAAENVRRQTQATLITSGGRKAFKITSQHWVVATIDDYGPFEQDDLMDQVEDLFGVTADVVTSVGNRFTWKITADDVPTLDRAMTFLEESGHLQDPSNG
jgi:hypothetical protein